MQKLIPYWLRPTLRLVLFIALAWIAWKGWQAIWR